MVTWIMVDVEADGPIPGDYSLLSIGAVVVERGLERTFYGRMGPISDSWVPEALAISGISREEHLGFDDPRETMQRFDDWLGDLGSDTLVFVSDNNGFDWQFVNWYFHHFLGRNPFGHTSKNLGSLYEGLVRDVSASFKDLRAVADTADPLRGAKANAEVLIHMWEQMGLKT